MLSLQFEILEKINKIRELFNDLEIESTRKKLDFKEVKRVLAEIEEKNKNLSTFLSLFEADETPF